MAEHEVIGPLKPNHIRQPPSVPFLWEERPGVATKDWRPVVSSVLPSPVKLVASVPFNWEEKPGKPLSCFSEPSMKSAAITQHVKLISLPSPPMYCSQIHIEQKFNNEDGGHVKHNGGIFDLDLQSFSFDKVDSFSTSLSLLANCLVPSGAVSAAVSVLKTSSTDDTDGQLANPSSPASETDSSTSSYATGISSLTGSSFLECLFPLYASNSSFQGEATYSGKGYPSPPELISSNLGPGSECNFMVRRTPTLGELIMMSRRSCQRKAVEMAQQNLSKEFISKKASGCCILGTGIDMIEGLQRKRRHPRLKLL